jgi:hypothetical protein
MQPRQEPRNRFRDDARAAKAAKYASAITDLAASCQLSPLEVFGRLDRAAWVQLSLIIGRKPTRGKLDIPSLESQALILNILRGSHRVVMS